MKLYVSRYQGAGLALVTKAGEGNFHILLGRRRHHPGKHQWSFPGGKRKRDETSAETALREAGEELSLWDGAPSWPTADKVAMLWSSPW